MQLCRSADAFGSRYQTRTDLAAAAVPAPSCLLCADADCCVVAGSMCPCIRLAHSCISHSPHQCFRLKCQAVNWGT